MNISYKNVHVILSLMVFIELPSRIVHLAERSVGIITVGE